MFISAFLVKLKIKRIKKKHSKIIMDTRRGLSAVCLPRPLMMGEMESLCFALDLMMQGSGFTRCEVQVIAY